MGQVCCTASEQHSAEKWLCSLNREFLFRLPATIQQMVILSAGRTSPGVARFRWNILHCPVSSFPAKENNVFGPQFIFWFLSGYVGRSSVNGFQSPVFGVRLCPTKVVLSHCLGLLLWGYDWKRFASHFSHEFKSHVVRSSGPQNSFRYEYTNFRATLTWYWRHKCLSRPYEALLCDYDLCKRYKNSFLMNQENHGVLQTSSNTT